ncbi:MAG: hypothetical protein AAGA55_07235 [Planctomycetota bacterium]
MHRRTALFAIAYAGTASAQSMDFVFDDRILVGFGSVETIDGYFDFGSQQSEPDSPFGDWSGFASDGAGSAGGSASLESTLSATSIVANGAANASASFDAGFTSFVSALGSSTHGIGFSLSEETTFLLEATLDASGTAQAWARVRNGFFGSDFVFDATTTGGPLVISETITLGPGDYEMEFFANSNISLGSAGSASGASSYSGSFTVVPSVPVLAIPAVGLALGMRRRRS